MGVVSGAGGAVNGQACVRNWSVNFTPNPVSYVCSASQGGTGRVTGNTDWSGSYDAYGEEPAVMPAETFQFKGSINGTVGVDSGATGAMVDQVEITWDIEGGGIISHTVNFSSNGALTWGASVAADASVPDPLPANVGVIKIDDPGAAEFSGSETTFTDVRSITLTISAGNQSYVSSSTAGVTKRVAGNIDATISFDVYFDDPTDLPTAQEVKAIRLYTTATEYWELRWVMFGEIGGVDVNIETADIVGATVNAGMNGHTSIGGTPTTGSIKTPAAATFWP